MFKKSRVNPSSTAAGPSNIEKTMDDILNLLHNCKEELRKCKQNACPLHHGHKPHGGRRRTKRRRRRRNKYP